MASPMRPRTCISSPGSPAEVHSQRQARGRKRGPTEDLLSKHEEQLQLWVCRDHLQLTRVHELLRQHCRVKVNYYALYRFVVAKEWLPAHRGTVRMAIGVLRDEGLVITISARGTFVKARDPQG